MTYFFNRILYSLFCIMRGFDSVLTKCAWPLIKKMYSFMYKWDPFNVIQKHHGSYEQYVKHMTGTIEYVLNDPESGDNIDWSFGALVAGAVSYAFLLFAYAKHFVMLNYHIKVEVLNHLDIALISAGVVGYFITTMRNNKYMEYFERFKNDPKEMKKNKKWHCIAFIYYIGTLVALFSGVIYALE